MRILIGIIMLVLGCVTGFIGYHFEETVKTEVVSKIQLNKKELLSNKVEYYYTTADSAMHEVTAAKYINIPQKGTWIHTEPSSSGTTIMIVGAVIALVGLVLISPDLAFLLVVLEGCT